MEAWGIDCGGLGEERTINFQNNFCFSTVSVIAFFNTLSDREHSLVKCFFLPFILVGYTPSPSSSSLSGSAQSYKDCQCWASVNKVDEYWLAAASSVPQLSRVF
jgi:hypothetical protein